MNMLKIIALKIILKSIFCYIIGGGGGKDRRSSSQPLLIKFLCRGHFFSLSIKGRFHHVGPLIFSLYGPFPPCRSLSFHYEDPFSSL